MFLKSRRPGYISTRKADLPGTLRFAKHTHQHHETALACSTGLFALFVIRDGCAEDQHVALRVADTPLTICQADGAKTPGMVVRSAGIAGNLQRLSKGCKSVGYQRRYQMIMAGEIMIDGWSRDLQGAGNASQRKPGRAIFRDLFPGIVFDRSLQIDNLCASVGSGH